MYSVCARKGTQKVADSITVIVLSVAMSVGVYIDAVRSYFTGIESSCPCASEVYRETYIELPSCQIVGHGVLQVVDIGYPVIRADIADVQQIEAIKAEPYTLDVL